MGINVGDKKVTDIVADGQPISEVYVGSNKVWGKDDSEPVPPHAMMFAVEKYSPLQRAVYAPEPTTSALSQFSNRTAILTTLLGPDGVVELKNGSDVRLKISRVGDSRTVSAWSKSDQSNTGTSTATASSDMPYIPVAVIIGTRTNGYTLRVWADGVSGTLADVNSTGWFAPTDVLQASELVTTNSWGTEWAPGVSGSSDWRKSAADHSWATPYFALAQEHNVGWEHFHGQRREWLYLTAAERDVLGRDYAWKYRNPAGTLDHDYTLPDGVTYQEGFFLSGAYQEGLTQGGQGGQGGRSGTDNVDGNCKRADGSLGGCSSHDGKGSNGADGGLTHRPWRNGFAYSRTTHILRDIKTIRVGRGSLLTTPIHWDDEERTGTDAQKGAGGAGGAGGTYVPGGSTLYAGALGTRPPAASGKVGNTLHNSAYVTSDGTQYVRPTTTGNEMVKTTSWDYYTSAGYDNYHDVIPTQCDGLEIETRTPQEDETRFNITESWWATNLPFWIAQRPVRFYTHRKGRKFSWPVEPTAGNNQSAYEDILAPGWGYGGTGGEGGAAGPIAGDGQPGKRGGGSWSDAGGPGVVAMYYEFEEPSA